MTSNYSKNHSRSHSKSDRTPKRWQKQSSTNVDQGSCQVSQSTDQQSHLSPSSQVCCFQVSSPRPQAKFQSSSASAFTFFDICQKSLHAFHKCNKPKSVSFSTLVQHRSTRTSSFFLGPKFLCLFSLPKSVSKTFACCLGVKIQVGITTLGFPQSFQHGKFCLSCLSCLCPCLQKVANV